MQIKLGVVVVVVVVVVVSNFQWGIFYDFCREEI